MRNLEHIRRNHVQPEFPMLGVEGIAESESRYKELIDFMLKNRPPIFEMDFEAFSDAASRSNLLVSRDVARDITDNESTVVSLVDNPSVRAYSGRKMTIDFYPWINPSSKQLFYMPNKSNAVLHIRRVEQMFCDLDKRSAKSEAAYTARIMRGANLDLPKPVALPDAFIDLFSPFRFKAPLYRVRNGYSFGREQDMGQTVPSGSFATTSQKDAESYAAHDIPRMEEWGLYGGQEPQPTPVSTIMPGALVRRPLPQEKYSHQKVDLSEVIVIEGQYEAS